MSHFAARARPGLSIEMQANAGAREGALERRLAVVVEPEIAEEIVNRPRAKRARVAKGQIAHRAHDLLELARRARDLGLVKGVVRSRRELVDENLVVADDEHLDRQDSLER